jgi:hypothetical protein
MRIGGTFVSILQGVGSAKGTKSLVTASPTARRGSVNLNGGNVPNHCNGSICEERTGSDWCRCQCDKCVDANEFYSEKLVCEYKEREDFDLTNEEE